MEAGPIRDAMTLMAGIATGMLSGAFGVGGATISTPSIRALGVDALTAVGTTLPCIFPSAIAGTIRYVRERLVDWNAVAWTAPAGVGAAITGSLLSRHVPGEGHVLMLATAALLGMTAARMAKSVPDNVSGAGHSALASRRHPALFVSVGAAAGLLSGLLGVGGGIVAVPGFSELIRMPLKRSIASSLVCVAIFAVPSTITHAALGGIDWRVALLLSAGVVPGARVGSWIAVRATDAGLRRAVAGFLGVIAILYGATEIWALVD